MSLFELETIEPPDKGLSGKGLAGKELKALEDAAFARGYKAGVDAANKGLAAEQNQYLASIVETLADQGFEFQKANARAEAAVADLVVAICDALAPDMARTHFDELLLSRVRKAAGQMLDGTLTLSVSAAAEERVRELLASAGAPAEVRGVEDLQDLQAELSWAGGTDRLDLDAVLGLINTAMSEYVEKLRELGDERHRSAG